MSRAPVDAVTARDYLRAVRAPGAPAPVCASVLARLPIAMTSLSVLLYVRQAWGSAGAAGLASGSVLAGTAAGMIVQGRVLDRHGPTRPLLVLVALFALTVASLIGAIETHAPFALVMACTCAAGVSTPAIEGASRALWSDLVPPGPARTAAYTYEAISLETFFVLGPALATTLAVATPWPGTALVTAASMMALGTAWFALTGAARRRPGHLGRGGLDDGRRLLGVLARPGLRVVLLAALGFGLTVGAVEVGVVAMASAAGSPAIAGLLLSAWAVVSVIAGALYSRRPWPRPLRLRLPVLLGGFALLVLCSAAAAATGSVVLFAAAMLTAGVLITPQVTTHSLGVEQTTAAGAATEAFNANVTAALVGLATGYSLAGVAVDAVGPPGLGVGALLGLAAAALVWRQRQRIDVGAA